MTLEELERERPSKIIVTEAAKIMGVTPMFLRLGLRQKCFPFGTAVKMEKRWAYYIHPVKFKAYIEGREVESTDIKFINEIEATITSNENIPDDERDLSQTIYECCSCHWRFIGEYGYGYDYAEVQTPNYCPMCGKEIKDLIE
jgi:hypothetical protein